MATNSKISWTDHTFNAWWGCTKVHPGCANCYAETWDGRWGGSHWGKDAPRRMVVGEWGKPKQWEACAKDEQRRCLVFASSMCDVFEDYPEDRPVVDQQGNPVLMPPQFYDRYAPGAKNIVTWTVPSLRARLLDIFEPMEWTTLLLLTKRPENIARMVPQRWLKNWPAHVWTGTSPCDNPTAEKCIPPLLEVPGKHFLSIEPMIGAVHLQRYDRDRINWVIVGGESEQRGNCREFPVEYAMDVVEWCGDATPCFVKQIGSCPTCADGPLDIQSVKGEDRNEWPLQLRVQRFPKEFGR